MSTKKANTLTPEQFERMMILVGASKHSERDRVMLLLSFKCGLRSCEIARLRWSSLVDAEGEIIAANEWITLGHDITKGKRPDTKVLMHPEVRLALVQLQKMTPNKTFLMYASQAKSGVMSVSNVTVYLYQMYQRFGFVGCSSHSGRRTFITTLSRICNTHGCSIKDVQQLARHADIRTTEKYIDPSTKVANLAAAI